MVNYTNPPVVPAPPNLPTPPNSFTVTYLVQLTNVLRLFFTQLVNAVQYYVVTTTKYQVSGTVTFTAATTAAVVFSVPQLSKSYFVVLGGNAAGYCWLSNKTIYGFTINCSVSNSNATDWQVTI